MRLRPLAAVVAVTLAACAGAATTPPVSPPAPTATSHASPVPSTMASGTGVAAAKTVRIGITLPLTADGTGPTDDVRDAVLLAIRDANASHRVPGIAIDSTVLDHTVDGADDQAKGVADMNALIGDPAVLGVVGPFNSYIAQAQIPLSNAAHLLQCSPATSNPDLTKGDAGRQLRGSNTVNFVRLAVTDDEIAPAIADYTVQTLHATHALVIDDGAGYGTSLADGFSARFKADGGAIVARRTTDFHATDYSALLAAGAKLHPDVVMFGGDTAPDGDTSAGAAILRSQMPAAGLGGVPLVGGPGLANQDGNPGSLIAIAGALAKGTYLADPTPSDYPGKAAFEAAFMAAYGHTPDPYAAPAYACAQVILAAIATASVGAMDREAVRAAATRADAKVDTILGTAAFDADGDTTTPAVTIYRVDPAAGGGTGGWVVDRSVVVRP